MQTKHLRYSIIVPFCGDEAYLQILLEGIYKQINNETEVIIVTNKALEIKNTFVTVHVTSEALPYPESINAGAKIAASDYLIFCDADCYPTPGSLKKLISFYHSNEKVGIASSKLISPYTGNILDFAVGFNTYNSPHIGRDRPLLFPLFSKDRRVQAACSATMIIKKELFSRLNGFDESLSYSYTDLDLCLRMKTLDKEIWVVADSVVFHRGNSSNPNSTIYKTDIKGQFWALNYNRIERDMPDYFRESYTFFNNKVQHATKSYLLVDLSTIADYKWHYDLFKSLGFSITDIYKHRIVQRDSGNIELYGHLTWNILKLRFPIIYFTDRFISITDNQLWWHLRDYRNDIVIDRNGNIETISNLLSQ